MIKSQRSSIILLVVALEAFGSTHGSFHTANAPLPATSSGGGFRLMGKDDAPIQLDLYEDLMCSDCKAAQPALDALLNYYSEQEHLLQVNLHLFPLPYHRHAFLSNHAAVVLASNTANNSSEIIRAWQKLVFEHQQDLLGADVTDRRYVEHLAQLADKNGLNGATLRQELQNPTSPTNEHLRIAWKFACLHGVSGTPTALLNGVTLVHSSDRWTLGDFVAMIEPLIHHQGTLLIPAESVREV